MISAFCSNGEFLCSWYQTTVDSDVFCDFIKLLKYWLKKLSVNTCSEVIIILDNAPYHSSAQTIEWLRSNGIQVEFLHPYCPTLAPVEVLFKNIKCSLKKLSFWKSIDYSKPTGIQIIRQACWQITDKIRHDAWISFIKERRKSIYAAQSLNL